MQVHIGREIERIYEKSGMKHAEFARRINTSSRNVYSIFSKPQIKTDQLQIISEVLNFDFFSIYVNSVSRGVEEPMNVYNRSRQRVLVTLELDGDPASLEQHVKRIAAINKLLQ
jgi:hypothetical protein